MRKLALFDLDNTLYTTKHRVHLIPNHDIRNNAQWLEWHTAFHSEKLNLPLIKTADAYKKAGFDIGVVSNRIESLREETRINLVLAGWPTECRYHLRALDDNRLPSMWKIQTIFNLLSYMEPVEVHIFDDDKKVLTSLVEIYCNEPSVNIIPHTICFE